MRPTSALCCVDLIPQVLTGTSVRDRAHLWVWVFSHLIIPCRWIPAVGEGWAEEDLKEETGRWAHHFE